MLFSSIVFLFFFLPLTLLLYYALSFSRLAQNGLLLLASLLFYAWGEPVYVLLMLFSIGFNALMGYLVAGRRKLWLVIAVGCNLGLLFVFKYLGFVLKILSMPGFSLALPIGISFYTFQALSYVVDVYRGEVKPESPFYVGLYIAFFPQLIAGPILPFRVVSRQLRERKADWNLFSLGVCRFVTGLGKKVLLAGNFAAVADNVFSWSAIGTERFPVPAALAWVGSIAYSLQIYFDFSGYSDMAVGLGAMFGFRFPENFNYPYSAVSVSDFWHRWHISLTNWFREYVYIPLGGSRRANRDDMVRNLLIVWLLTGIWHGANWTFLLWGLFYFVIQLAERFFGYPEKLPRFWGHIYTLLTVNFAWVLFRADDLYQAGRYLLNLFGLNRNGFFSDQALMFLGENWVFFLAGILFSTPILRNANEYLFRHPGSRWNRLLVPLYPLGLLALLAMCVSYLASGSYNPFIYFNF